MKNYLTIILLCLITHGLSATDASVVPGNLYLSTADTLSAATITGKIDRNINFTQTGLTQLDGDAFRKGFALFSAPDVLKTLQILPGVASGTELLSSLYVHGGDGSDNLFLMDGVPLYQIAHLGGIFSAFNTDFIESVDFYKSGFPSRYGGRMSSVVDIKGKDGSFTDYSGSWSVGLLEGRFQIDGPIVKNRTSFNLALRRTWADLIMYPVCGIINAKAARSMTEGMSSKSTYAYSFTDLNFRLTHKFSPGSRLAANLYVGNDQFLMRSKQRQEFSSEELTGWDDSFSKTKLIWGNMLVSVNWTKDFSHDIDMRLCGYWSGTRTDVIYNDDYKEDYFHPDMEYKSLYSYSTRMQNKGVLDDGGVTADFNWRPSSDHHVRFGASGIIHSYRPTYSFYDKQSDVGIPETEKSDYESLRALGEEFSLYIEDEMRITDWFKANIGLRNTTYFVPGKAWNSLEPRVAVKFQCGPNVSIKASYSEMSQFSHRLATTYLDLPTDCWVPSNSKVAPMRSRQVAGGIYTRLPAHFHLNVEAWYKTMSNLIEFDGMNTFFPRVEEWEKSFNLGKGRSYGVEADFGYETKKLSLNAFYTLSWNWRKFDDIWYDWYRDRNDNRHKFTFMANWRASRKVELYAAWNFHSGNRMSVATQYIDGIHGEQYIYETPNNVKLPDYHRLDIGINIQRKTKRGNDAVWNVSIYNLYSRLNPLYAYVRTDGSINPGAEPGSKVPIFKCVGVGIVPIIPTFSYTCTF